MRSVRGFTLIEISIVIAIMLAMLTMELVADEFERLPGNQRKHQEAIKDALLAVWARIDDFLVLTCRPRVPP